MEGIPFVLRGATLRAGPAAGDVDLSGLNDPQRAAVTAPPGPLLVVAGPGSGKTRTIVHRVAWLLARGEMPDGVLLVTFTQRAARLMLRRVATLVGPHAQRVWGGTFHHVCHRILRECASEAGLPDGFSILDRGDAQTLLRACLAERAEGWGRRAPGADLVETARSLALNTGRGFGETLARLDPAFADRAAELAPVLARYEERKRAAGLVDYDDLLVRCRALLRDIPDVAERYARRFRHVLVDEFQDTNPLQVALVEAWSSVHRGVFAVADDAQSIYRFRGADVDGALRFADRFPGARVLPLEWNYRSTPQILAVANAVIANNPRQHPKTLRATRPDGTKPLIAPCEDALQQAAFVAEYVLKLRDEGRAFRDVAVLYRSHWNPLELEMEMKRREIPYAVRGGIRFFEQAHVKDVLSFLRIAQNPRDDLAWLRALPTLPKVGARTAHRIAARLEPESDPAAALTREEVLREAPPSARPALAAFALRLANLRAPDVLRAPGTMIRKVLDGGYREYLRSRQENAPLREQDLEGLADYAATFPSCGEFLAELSLADGLDAETAVAGPADDDRVTLSTVHQAKGLEWPVVILIWMAEGRFPTDMAGRDPDPEAMAEERRLFYVATTRARDELVCAYPQTYRWRGMRRPALMKRSRFLDEALAGAPGGMESLRILERPVLDAPVAAPGGLLSAPQTALPAPPSPA